jgi:hypothetical protein
VPGGRVGEEIVAAETNEADDLERFPPSALAKRL